MSEEIKKEFGEVSNQFGAVMAMGRISVMYDVDNEITIDARIGRYDQGERELVVEQIKRVVEFDKTTQGHRGHEGDLFLFDMGYPALYWMGYLIVLGKDFVMRTKGSFLKEVQEAIQTGEQDVVIQIPISKPRREVPRELRQLVEDIDPKMVIPVRVIKLELEDGKQEILLTTLVKLVLEQGDLSGFYEGLKKQMKRDLVPIRPGRRFARKRRNRQKYPMNKKRAL
jgi:hypothetical protein